MEIKFLIFFLVLIFILSNVSSASINVKSSFLHNENFVATVKGNFYLPLTIENINFYRRHLPTVMKNVRITQIENNFYVTAEIPPEKIPDDYSIVIKNIFYFIGDKIYSDNLVGNFSILNEEVSFSISPNFENWIKNYSFSLSNLKQTPLKINYTNFEGTGGSLFLDSFESKKIFFDSNLIGLKKIKFNSSQESYDVFAYVSSLLDSPMEGDNCTSVGYVCVNSCNGTTFSEYNCDENDICCFVETIFSEENFTLNNNTIVNESEENKTFWEIVKNLFGSEENKTNQSKREKNNTNEENDTGKGFFSSLFGGNNENNSIIETCKQLDFIICGEGKECTGETTDGKDGLCCKEKCEKKLDNSTWKTIGWISIVIFLFGGVLFFKNKYKRIKSGPILSQKTK